MQRVLLIVIITISFLNIFAQSSTVLYSVTGGGNWSSSSTWSLTSGSSTGGAGVPGGGDVIYIESNVILDVDVKNPGISLYINSGGSLVKSSLGGPYGIYLKTNGILDISGSISIDNLNIKNGSTMSINSTGVVDITNLITGSNNTLIVDGELSAGTIDALVITGTGTVTATVSYTGTYNIYGATSLTAGTTYYGQGWQGGTSTAWETASNWKSGTVPTSNTTVQITNVSNLPVISSNAVCKNLVISTSSSLTVNSIYSITVNGDLTNDGTLTLKSDASGTASLINSGTISGSGTYNIERYLTGGGYHYVSSSVNASPTSVFSGAISFYYYNETNTSTNPDDGWTAVSTSSGSLINGLGYAAFYSSNTTLNFTSTPNTGNISVNATRAGTNTADGYNLLGNPYPSAINASSFFSTNSGLDGTIYFWSDDATNGADYDRSTDYAVYTTSGGVGATGGGSSTAPDGKIPAGQGFVVKVPNTTSSPYSVSFTNVMRETNTTQYFIPQFGEIQRVWVGLKGKNGEYNEILVAFSTEASVNEDRGFDAIKLKGNPYISFYSKIEDKDYIIQGLPFNEEDNSTHVDLGFDLANSGDYSIELVETENMNDIDIFVFDKYLNQIISLSELKSYAFTSQDGKFDDRIQLIFNKRSSLISNKVSDNKDLNVYSFGNQIICKNNTEQNLQITVCDLLGKELMSSSTIVGDKLNTFEINNFKGIVVVKIWSNNIQLSKKIYIR